MEYFAGINQSAASVLNLSISLDTRFVGEDIPRLQKSLFIALGALLFVSGTFGNLLMLVTLVRCPTFHGHHYVYLANLAVADLIIECYSSPFMMLDLIIGHQPVLNREHCIFNGFLVVTCYVSSLFTLAGISFNRYMHVCRFAMYQRYVTRQWTLAICVGVWFTSAAIASAPLAGWGRYGYDVKTHYCSYDRTASVSYTALISVGTIALPASAVCIFNFRIFRFVRKVKSKVYRWKRGNTKTQTKECASSVSAIEKDATDNTHEDEEVSTFIFDSVPTGLRPELLKPENVISGNIRKIRTRQGSPSHKKFKELRSIFTFQKWISMKHGKGQDEQSENMCQNEQYRGEDEVFLPPSVEVSFASLSNKKDSLEQEENHDENERTYFDVCEKCLINDTIKSSKKQSNTTDNDSAAENKKLIAREKTLIGNCETRTHAIDRDLSVPFDNGDAHILPKLRIDTIRPIYFQDCDNLTTVDNLINVKEMLKQDELLIVTDIDSLHTRLFRTSTNNTLESEIELCNVQRNIEIADNNLYRNILSNLKSTYGCDSTFAEDSKISKDENIPQQSHNITLVNNSSQLCSDSPSTSLVVYTDTDRPFNTSNLLSVDTIEDKCQPTSETKITLAANIRVDSPAIVTIHQVSKKDLTMIKSIFLVFICLSIFMSPYMVSIIVDTTNQWPAVIHCACSYLAVTNNAINWILYGFMNSSFRAGYKKTLTSLCSIHRRLRIR